MVPFRQAQGPEQAEGQWGNHEDSRSALPAPLFLPFF